MTAHDFVLWVHRGCEWLTADDVEKGLSVLSSCAEDARADGTGSHVFSDGLCHNVLFVSELSSDPRRSFSPSPPPHWDLTHSLHAALVLLHHGGLGRMWSRELGQMEDNQVICNFKLLFLHIMAQKSKRGRTWEDDSKIRIRFILILE